MKHKKEWSWRKIFVVFGLIVCVVWFILAVDALPEVWTPRPVLWENVDSIKLFLYSQHWSAEDTMKLVDSTAGAARADTNRYDTNLIVDGDSAYDAVFAIWDYPDYTEWTWHWVAPKLDTVYWTAGGPGDDTVKVCAYDTVGAGDSSLVSNVKITVKDNTGEQVAAPGRGHPAVLRLRLIRETITSMLSGLAGCLIQKHLRSRVMILPFVFRAMKHPSKNRTIQPQSWFMVMLVG